MNRIGKIGRANLKANKEIDKYFIENDINYCEINFPGCTGKYNLTRCHKERRENYRHDLTLLYNPKEVLLGCQSCHTILDDRSKTTKEQSDKIFKQKRECLF